MIERNNNKIWKVFFFVFVFGLAFILLPIFVSAQCLSNIKAIWEKNNNKKIDSNRNWIRPICLCTWRGKLADRHLQTAFRFFLLKIISVGLNVGLVERHSYLKHFVLNISIDNFRWKITTKYRINCNCFRSFYCYSGHWFDIWFLNEKKIRKILLMVEFVGSLVSHAATYWSEQWMNPV